MSIKGKTLLPESYFIQRKMVMVFGGRLFWPQDIIDGGSAAHLISCFTVDHPFIIMSDVPVSKLGCFTINMFFIMFFSKLKLKLIVLDLLCFHKFEV